MTKSNQCNWNDSFIGDTIRQQESGSSTLLMPLKAQKLYVISQNRMSQLWMNQASRQILGFLTLIHPSSPGSLLSVGWYAHRRISSLFIKRHSSQRVWASIRKSHFKSIGKGQRVTNTMTSTQPTFPLQKLQSYGWPREHVPKVSRLRLHQTNRGSKLWGQGLSTDNTQLSTVQL